MKLTKKLYIESSNFFKIMPVVSFEPTTIGLHSRHATTTPTLAYG